MRCVSFVKRRRRRRRSLLPCSHVGWRGYEEGRTRTRRDEKQGGNGGRRDGLGWREGNPEGGTSREKERGRGGGRQMRRRRGRSPPPSFPPTPLALSFSLPSPQPPSPFPTHPPCLCPSLPLGLSPTPLSHSPAQSLSLLAPLHPSLFLRPPSLYPSLIHSRANSPNHSLSLPSLTSCAPLPLFLLALRAPACSVTLTPVLFLSSLSHSLPFSSFPLSPIQAMKALPRAFRDEKPGGVAHQV